MVRLETSIYQETGLAEKVVGLRSSGTTTEGTQRTPWRQWTAGDWTVGSCESRWQGMAARRHPRTAAAAVVAQGTALDQGHAQGHAVGAAAGQGLAPGQGRGQGHAVATLGQGVTAGAERGREPTLVQEASLLLVLPKNTRTPQLVPLPTTTTTTTARPPPPPPRTPPRMGWMGLLMEGSLGVVEVVEGQGRGRGQGPGRGQGLVRNPDQWNEGRR